MQRTNCIINNSAGVENYDGIFTVRVMDENGKESIDESIIFICKADTYDNAIDIALMGLRVAAIKYMDESVQFLILETEAEQF